tara:strand:- start:2020 stop:2196 length:177 start_codon:yes stop_codon:yes gene_type:complete
MTAAERFKKRVKGGAPHTVNKKKIVDDNPYEEPLVMHKNKKLPDYTRFLAEPSWMRNK